MATSSDGETWTAVTTSAFSSSDVLKAITYGGGTFVAVGYGYMWTSSDGENWMKVSSFKESVDNEATHRINCIAYGGGKFVAGSQFGKAAISTDGAAWEAVSSWPDTDGFYYIYGFAYGGGQFVSVGTHGAPYFVIAYSNAQE